MSCEIANPTMFHAAPATEVERTVVLVVFVLSLVLAVVNFVVFRWYKPYFQRLKVRITFFYYFYFVAVVCMVSAFLLPVVVDNSFIKKITVNSL